MRIKVSQSFVFVLPVAVLAATTGSSADELSAGIAALEGGRCQEALSYLNEAARKRPDSAEVHYQRGKVLSVLGRTDEAVKELKLAICLKPQASFQAQCRAALEEAEQRGAEIKSQPVRTSHSAGAVDPPEVKNALRRILKQTEGRMKESVSYGRAGSYFSSRGSDHWHSMWPFSQYYSSGRSSRYRSRNYGSDSHTVAARQRADAFHQAASGLESQMVNRPGKWSGVVLEPSGTNLYVRNYSHFTPEQPEPEEPLQAEALLHESLRKKTPAAKAKGVR